MQEQIPNEVGAMSLEPASLKTKQEYVDFFRVEGLNVIPCQPKKKEPAVAWKKYQTERYIEPIPDENNIAVLCGAISGGLVVIDLDAPELIKEMDFESIKKNTLVVQSGSGGYHIYCKPNEKIHTMRLQNDLGQHVDIQSDGTYVLAPPSIHPDSGEEYKIISSTLRINSNLNMARILDKFEKLGFKTKGTKPLADIIRGVTEGQRNNACFRYACHLFQKVRMDKETAWHEIQRWNQTNSKPLDENELTMTFESAFTYKDNPEFVEQRQKKKDDEPTHTEYALLIMSKYIFKTIQETDDILVYDEGVYRRGGDIIIKQECERLIPDCSKYMVNEVTATISRRTGLPKSAFNSNSNLIHLENCIYDLDQGKVLDFNPDILATVKIPVRYDQTKKPVRFIRFLNQCLSPRDVFTIIEQMASCLIKSAKFGKAFMYVGEGSNGKSTLLYVLENMLGKQNISHISIHELDESRFAKAELDGKLANIYADISNQELRNVGILKIMITGDMITVERKNRDPYSMENFGKLFFSANQIPQVYDDSDGFYRRFMLVEWNRKFADREANINLKYELTTDEEKSGILNILLHFARLLNKRGYFVNGDQVLTLRQKWKEKANSVEQFFETQMAYADDFMIEKTRLYQAYTDWCKRNKLYAANRKTFQQEVIYNSNLEDDGKPHRLENGKQARVWLGGKLKTDMGRQRELE